MSTTIDIKNDDAVASLTVKVDSNPADDVTVAPGATVAFTVSYHAPVKTALVRNPSASPVTCTVTNNGPKALAIVDSNGDDAAIAVNASADFAVQHVRGVMIREDSQAGA